MKGLHLRLKVSAGSSHTKLSISMKVLPNIAIALLPRCFVLFPRFFWVGPLTDDSNILSLASSSVSCSSRSSACVFKLKRVKFSTMLMTASSLFVKKFVSLILDTPTQCKYMGILWSGTSFRWQDAISILGKYFKLTDCIARPRPLILWSVRFRVSSEKREPVVELILLVKLLRVKEQFVPHPFTNSSKSWSPK